MKPLIGITCYHEFDKENASRQYEAYYLGIERAGGLPILIPNVDEVDTVDKIYSKLDGILLAGGEDLDPGYFKENPHPQMGAISPVRDKIEIHLAVRCLEDDKPLLGICRGMQVLNAAAGGTLYQDIYSQLKDREIIKHTQEGPRWNATHTVKLRPGSKLHQIFKEKELRVNSIHHQAVKDVARDFMVTAQAPDGIIEGMEGVSFKFVVAVQWHPERMWQKYPIMLKLFKAFVEAARK